MKMASWLLTLTLVSLASVATCKPPNIVFIVVDDLGWNDIGFHNPDIISPNVDKLAKEGVILNQAYVQPVCSPSRTAFTTGYYPYRVGMQHLAMLPRQAVCLPRNVTSFLPQEMKSLGYATHIVGKWHLGFCHTDCTPTERGFDSFLGYYNGQIDYYTRKVENYYDFRDNLTLSKKDIGTYSTIVYRDRVRQILDNHDKKTPLFLYLPLQSVHEPLQVPKSYYDMYPNIKNEDRRIFSGMVTAMDDLIGNVTSYLTQRNMINDTLIFLTSDNGGWVTFGGNNYPLRGGKLTIWEGGTRAVALASGAGLNSNVKGTVYDGMMHAVDWMPTIVTAAGGKIKDKDIDGVSLWDGISTGSQSPRTEFIYNLDDTFPPLEGHAGIRQGDYKLLVGLPGIYNGWYLPNGTVDPMASEKVLDFLNKNAHDSTRLQAKMVTKTKPFTMENVEGLENIPRLYNLKDDPNEYNNLAAQMPDMVEKLMQRMKEYKKKYVPADYPLPDPASSPWRFGGAWSPGWC